MDAEQKIRFLAGIDPMFPGEQACQYCDGFVSGGRFAHELGCTWKIARDLVDRDAQKRVKRREWKRALADVNSD